jgi:hypothetical protein
MMQAKNIGGRIVSWEVDTNTIRLLIPWAARRPERLALELQGMALPVFQTHLAILYDEETHSGGKECPACHEVLVFWEGIRCPRCLRTVPASRGLLAYVGRLPTPVGRMEGDGPRGRPSFKHMYRRLLAGGQQALWDAYFLTVGNQVYFAPPVLSVLPDNCPHAQPSILFWDSYFEVLGIPREHAYTRGGLERASLCIYANWHQDTLAVVLQQRIIPRIIIDLCLADLAAVGQLYAALRRLGTDMHGVYNYIGKPRLSQAFKQVYDQYVTID